MTFMNIFCLLTIVYQSVAKMATNSGVDPMDLCLVRTFLNFCLSCVTVTWLKSDICGVPKEDRGLLAFRSLTGIIGFTGLVFAVQILPISMVGIIFNTAPFWTAIL